MKQGTTRLLSALLALCMVLALLPGTARAAEIASGTCGENGDNVIWTLTDDGTLTISGTGAMENYTYNPAPDGNKVDAPWYDHYDAITSVIIGSGITTIGKLAFAYCSSLTSVTVPDSVTVIGEDAFYATPWQESLGEFAVVNGILLKYQGDGGAVTIPGSVTSIGAEAFSYCGSLTGVVIPGGVTEIGERAFLGCASLTNVTIPDSITEIGERAFFGCSGLTGVVIPDNVTSIGECTFSGCSGLTSVVIPGSVTVIGESAFYDTPWLESLGEFAVVNGILLKYQGDGGAVTIPDSVTSIGVNAFEHCSSLTRVAIPDSVTVIGEDAFSYCDSLTSVTIPDSVTVIGGSAFSGCSSLTSVTIPDNVTVIRGSTFSECSSLTSVTIPNSVTTIEEGAFYYCDHLTDVYYAGSKSQWKQMLIDNLLSTNELLLSAAIHYNSTGPGAPDTDAVSVTVKGEAVEWTDAGPFIDDNGRTMVPLRAVADAMGLTVAWDGDARVASLTDGCKTINFIIGCKIAFMGDGTYIAMDTAPVVIHSRTYAPIRYLAEYFGYTVDWNQATRTVIIT